MMNKCFENDFSISKIDRILKNEVENAQVKEVLRKHYYHVKEAFRYYSGIAPMNKMLCMSAMIFNEFVNCTNLLDNQILASNDIAIEFKGTTANVKDQKWNPPNGLIRHQLVEMLVRLALRKK